MFSHLRLTPKALPPRPCLRPCPCRATVVRRSSIIPDSPSNKPESSATETTSTTDPDAPSPQEEMQMGLQQEETEPESYNEFLEAIGNQFRRAKPRNWLGVEVPFPMNPSFRPPAPVPDALRTKMYKEYMQNPEENNVRVLSQRYHVSLKRVDAILRLKGQEEEWLKGKTLQTGFLVGMEKLLGVKEDERIRNTLPEDQRDWTRYDVHEADTLEEEENRDAARQRYQHSYWESVPEDGREPIVPGSLEHAKLTAKRFVKAEERHKSDPKLMPRFRDTETIKTPQRKVQLVTRPGRPAMKFVDVGGKFIEVDERLRRIADGERRSKIKIRQAGEKKAAISRRRNLARND